MKKNAKNTVAIMSTILTGILIYLLTPIIIWWLGVGALVIGSGGLTDLVERVGYTTPFIWQTESKISSDKLVTNDILFKEVMRILKNYDCVVKESEIYNNEWAKFYTIINEHDDVSAGKVLHVYAEGNIGINLEQYNDIKAMMDIWLFITEHQIAEEIDGVCYWFLKKGKNASPTEINISMYQFQEFYRKSNVDTLSRKEKIDALTKLWVEKVAYTRPHRDSVNVNLMIE